MADKTFDPGRYLTKVGTADYLNRVTAEAALPWLRDAMDCLGLDPESPGWSELFTIQLGLEHIVKYGADSNA